MNPHHFSPTKFRNLKPNLSKQNVVSICKLYSPLHLKHWVEVEAASEALLLPENNLTSVSYLTPIYLTKSVNNFKFTDGYYPLVLCI